jgi:hypothetical protein
VPLNRAQLISGHAAIKVAGISRTQRWRETVAGKFPQPIRPNTFMAGDIVDCIQKRREALGLPPMKEDDILALLVEAQEALDHQR